VQTDSTAATLLTLLKTEKRPGQSRAQRGGENCRASDAALAGNHCWPPTRHRLMVPLIIVYFRSRRQLLLRGERIGGHFVGRNEGLCAPFFWNSPPTSASFLKSSSTERVRRSTLRAGRRVVDFHQPQISDAPILPQRLYGTYQWWHCWLPVSTQTPVLPADKLQRLCQSLALSLELLLTDRPGYTLVGRPAALTPAVALVHTLIVIDLKVSLRASPSALLLSPKPHTPRGSRTITGTEGKRHRKSPPISVSL
jgi:hypothetical protein